MTAALRAVAVLLAFLLSGAAAASDEAARALYVKTCSKCHGLLQEDAQSWRRGTMVLPAVTLPLGPTLLGAVLAGLPSLLFVILGAHWLGALVAVGLFAAWCARLPQEPAAN